MASTYALGAASLRLAHTKLLRDEAIFDYLVNVLFLSKRTLTTDVEVAHLLAYVGLMDALRMAIADVPMAC